MPVQSITAEMVGLSGRIRAGRRSSRSSLRRITAEDVWPSKPVEAPRERVVSGDWLASVLRADKELVAQLAGREVTVEEEAWFGVQAHLNARLKWSARLRKIARQRAKHWLIQDTPVGTGPLEEWLVEDPPCACIQTQFASPRFVDSELGVDSNTGGFVGTIVGGVVRLAIKPWKTLCQVETWLNGLTKPGACVEGAGVFLRRGRVWTGDEEPGQRTRSCPCDAPAGTVASWEDRLFDNSTTHNSAALTVIGFKATGEHPLFISAYGGEDESGPDTRPRIDGGSGRATGARYGGEDVGILLFDCCHVLVANIAISGFWTAIWARRGSKQHVYEDVVLHGNSRAGVQIGTTQDDLGVSDASTPTEISAAIAAAVEASHYPADIAVVDCVAYSNGYDTDGPDIELGFLATNCTVSGNTLKGGSSSPFAGAPVRGIDGVVSQGGSSGHLIEKNQIGDHRAWCTVPNSGGGSDIAKIGQGSSCGSSSDFTVEHPCTTAAAAGTCVDLRHEYGFYVTYVGSPSLDSSAVGEDGIDLKGVRQRTPDARKETIICDNVVWGHTSFGFTGITVNDGSRDVYIFRNRIFQNSAGIYVGNNGSTGFYRRAVGEEASITQDVYIYRNLVYMNEQRGIFVESGDLKVISVPQGPSATLHRRVENVWIVNNTIAHNLWTGVHVRSESADGDVIGVFMYNNLIARNGIAGTNDDKRRQVTWSAGVDLVDPTCFRSDFNCYLGWSGDAGLDLRWDGTDKSRDQAATDWGIETAGEQVADIGDLDLFGSTDLAAAEGTNGGALPSYVQNTASSAVKNLDFDVASTTSPVYRVGIIAVGESQAHSSSDLVQSVDINGVQAFAISPTVGAFEGPT